MNTAQKLLATLLPPLVALTFAGCESNIRPIQPLMRVELWIPDDGSPAITLAPPELVPEPKPAFALPPDTQPATPRKEFIPPNTTDTKPATLPADSQPATASAPTSASAPASAPETLPAATQLAVSNPATTSPATEPASTLPALPLNLPPGQKFIKIIDPNQTVKFIYKASYNNIWQQSLQLVSRMGFSADRQDFRLGVLTTLPLPSSQVLEFWKPQQTVFKNAMENTVNSQRRSIRITISPDPGKPDFYEIAIQVLVERQTNPSEAVGGPIFVEGSGLGRSSIALRSDYADVTLNPPRWIILGHDVQLERKLLDQLFHRI